MCGQYVRAALTQDLNQVVMWSTKRNTYKTFPLHRCMSEFMQPKKTQRFFVLIDTEGGNHEKVMNKLRDFPETTEIHTIFGNYDILLVLDIERHFLQETLENGMRFIAGKITTVPGIKDTETITVGNTFIKQKEL